MQQKHIVKWKGNNVESLIEMFYNDVGSGGNDQLLLKQGMNYHTVLTLCMLGTVIFHPFVVLCFFLKFLSGTLSECQTVWIQIRTDI